MMSVIKSVAKKNVHNTRLKSCLYHNFIKSKENYRLSRYQ